MKLNLPAFVMMLALAAGTALAQHSITVQFDAPEDWRGETITIPPGFARDMALKGIEEIRFAPGMFKSESEDFFSYVLVFWLPNRAPLDAKEISVELLKYYRGLATAVGQGKNLKIDTKKFTIDVKAKPKQKGHFTVSIDWIEPFSTGKPQKLNMEVHTKRFESANASTLAMAVSPQPTSHKVWKQLRTVLTSVRYISAAAKFSIPGAPKFPMKRPWGEIRKVANGLEIHVTSPKNVVLVPRLNNPIGLVYLKGDAKKKKLKFKPLLTEWSITLPKGTAKAVIMMETIGEPYLPVKPRIVPTGKDGVITLGAHDAVTHGRLLRYEPQPHKNTVGYWADEKDYCEWHLDVAKPGRYEVHILQGCGKGQGGSEVAIFVGGEKVNFIVEDTGHFQNFKMRNIGELTIAKAGNHTLRIRPMKKAKNAVMDVRQLKLVPVKK